MRNTRNVLLELLLVAGAGLIFSLAANAISPRGLKLGRNHFPEGSGKAGPLNTAGQPGTAGATNNPSEERLKVRGLQVASFNEVSALFRDQRYEQGLVVFVDARNDERYQAGHIPGAWQFDHYRAENYLAAVLPAVMSAEKVVVYCTGGACEDSEFAAIMLRDAGVPAEKLFVFVGGYAEWSTNSLPVETGARGSGQLMQAKP